MAVTSGHGNGLWTKEETILALDLYFSCDQRVPSRGDPRVAALSQFLRSLAIHPPHKKKESFRNPDGVRFKIQNLRAVKTGRGLGNVSHVDRSVWGELGANPQLVKHLAEQIRSKF
jgi:5-methylcytosine-specific restriction protein A